jgi:hypothetical protein
MRKIILLVILVALGWKGYERYGRDLGQTQTTPELMLSTQTEPETPLDIDVTSSSRSKFACDGRVYCSQMKSCDEAKYFVEHCPNVKMDGNNDGVPCEKQWCG